MTTWNEGNPQTLRRRKGAAPAAHHPEHDTVAGWHGVAKGPSSRKVAGLTTVSLPPGTIVLKQKSPLTGSVVHCTQLSLACGFGCLSFA